jgi:23S rRNA (adenine2503-C2)-methyltransferase
LIEERKKCIQDHSLEEITAIVLERGFPKFRSQQIFELSLSYRDWAESSNIPKSLSEAFSDYVIVPAKIISKVNGNKGVTKYLFLLTDNSIVEGVYLPNNYGNTVCVSSQVGCARGCEFCASGINGLIRDLSPGEILGQVLAINREKNGTKNNRAISNVVLMGSGEPLDNYVNVIRFIRLITSENGLNISPRNITLSTCGIPDKIYKLAKEEIPLTLTISLHASSDIDRQKIMPIAKVYSIKDVVKAADFYYSNTGRRVSYEYALTELSSKNESIDDLVKLLKGKQVHINLIRLNPVRGKSILGSEDKRAEEIKKILGDNGISATIRRSLGSDIDGACGQLRNHFLADGKKIKDFSEYSVIG